MKQKYIISFLTILLLISGSICGCSDINQTISIPSIAEYTVEEIKIQDWEDLHPKEGEKVAVLDVKGSHMLITVYCDYQPEDPLFREVGYNSYSSRLLIYDWEIADIVFEFSMSENELCPYGVLSEDGVLCTLLGLEPAEGLYSAKIVRMTIGFPPETIFSCSTANSNYYVPRIAMLNDGTAVFTYIDNIEGSFGIQTISPENVVTPIYSSNDMNSFIGTELRGNGIQFIYYTFINGKMSLLLGNSTTILSTVTLEDTQQMQSFGLTDQYIFVSLQNQQVLDRESEICLFNFEGELLFRRPYDPAFSPTYDKIHGLLISDLNYHSYSLSFATEDDKITVNRKLLPLPNNATAFYPVDQSICLIYSEGDRPRLFALKSNSTTQNSET